MDNSHNRPTISQASSSPSITSNFQMPLMPGFAAMPIPSPPIQVPNHVPNNTFNTAMHPPADMTSTLNGQSIQNSDSLSVGNSKKRKNRKNKSPCWAHFEREKLPNGDDNMMVATCVHCGDKEVKASSADGTSCMWNHMRSCQAHPDRAVEAEKRATHTDKDPVSYLNFSQAKSELECIAYIIRDELPFRHVEGKGFISFLYVLQPRFKIPSRRAIAKGVWDLFTREKLKLMNQIADNNIRVSITTDTWTSIQNINYMVVTAHFMDANWKLHKRIINFCPITSHKGEDIGKQLELCLREWGINKIFTITVDNAKTNDSAIAYIKRSRMNWLMFGGNFLHMRCACHIINLIVKDGLALLKDNIEAIQNAVKYIRSSPARFDKFRECAVLEDESPNANVPLDVATRWNSTYMMLEAALKYKKVFDRMVFEDPNYNAYFLGTTSSGEFRVGPPSEVDWRKAAAFVVFLKKFYESTVRLSAWKTVTAHVLFIEMTRLHNTIAAKSVDMNDFILQGVAVHMMEKFAKYWKSFETMNKLIIIGNVLDPRWKLQYQEKAFKKMLPNKVTEITAAIKALVLRMFLEYKGAPSELRETPATEFGDQGSRMYDSDDEVAEAVRRERAAQQSSCITNEVDAYFSEKCVEDTPEFEVAIWWKLHAANYPCLSALAKDVYSMPCSTVASENAFSLGSRIVDPFRASLTPRMVEELVCCSDWLNASEVDFFKEPSEDELQLYKTLEELEKEEEARRTNINSAP